jgi:hypothetical protein
MVSVSLAGLIRWGNPYFHGCQASLDSLRLPEEGWGRLFLWQTWGL